MRAAASTAAEVETPDGPDHRVRDDRRRARRLARFFSGRVLNEIPSEPRQTVVVLQRLALEFDPGRRYTESRGQRDSRSVPPRLVDAAPRPRRRGPPRPCAGRRREPVLAQRRAGARITDRVSDRPTLLGVGMYRDVPVDRPVPAVRARPGRAPAADGRHRRRSAAGRQAAAAARRVRLHRRRGRGRAHDGEQRGSGSPASSSARTCCATSAMVDTSTTLLGKQIPLPLDPRPDRVHPASPTRKASCRWPGPRRVPACRTRCRR